MAKGFRIFRLFRFVFFQYFNQLYDLGIPLWNPASISSSDTWSCAITRLTILIQISQAMSIQQWAKVARFQHVSTAEGQSPHAAAVRQQFRHPLWQGVSKDKRSKLSCCKADAGQIRLLSRDCPWSLNRRDSQLLYCTSILYSCILVLGWVLSMITCCWPDAVWFQWLWEAFTIGRVSSYSRVLLWALNNCLADVLLIASLDSPW